MGEPIPEDKQLEVVTTVWGQYRQMAKTSRRLKAEQGGWRKALLIGSVAAVLTTPFAGTFRAYHFDAAANVVVAVGAVLFALMAWLNKQVLGDDSDQAWVVARTVGEGLKSLTYRFLGGVAPYDGTDGVRHALEQARTLVAAPTTPADPISEAEASERRPKVPLSIDAYIETRIDDQIKHYRAAAEREKTVIRQTTMLGLAISAALAILGAASGFAAGWRDIWAPALGVASTMIASQMTLARRRFLVELYSTAAVKLEFARTEWRVSAKGATDKEKLVNTAETIFNDENAGWVQQILLKPKPSASVNPNAGGDHNG